MSEKDKNEIKNSNQILNSIFISDSSENDVLCPIINDKTKILDLIFFLKDTEYNIQEKIKIISIIYNLFTKNSSLIFLFMKKDISNTINFYEPLIDLYLSEEISKDNNEIIENIIKLISTKVTINKAPIQYLCQKLSNYFNNLNNNEKMEFNI